MRVKTFTVLVLGLLLILTGCNNVSDNEADVTDETFLTPPEQEGTITGIWNTEKDELTIDSYFYGDGKLVTIIKDPEEDYACELSTWNEIGDEISVASLESYAYDDNSGSWEKIENFNTETKIKKTGDDSYTTELTLPDGVKQTFDFKRGLSEMSVPNNTDLLGYINAFLGH